MSRVKVAEAVLAGLQPRTGLTLRELRNLRGISLRQAEVELGFSRAQLSKIERGIEVPTPVHLLALSDLYGVPPEEWRLSIEFRMPAEIAGVEFPEKEAA